MHTTGTEVHRSWHVLALEFHLLPVRVPRWSECVGSVNDGKFFSAKMVQFDSIRDADNSGTIGFSIPGRQVGEERGNKEKTIQKGLIYYGIGVRHALQCQSRPRVRYVCLRARASPARWPERHVCSWRSWRPAAGG